MAAVSGKVELGISWCGDYSYEGHNVSNVDLFLKCGGDAISGKINTQIPSSLTQKLELRLSEKISPEQCRQLHLPLWSGSNQNVRMAERLRCPLHTAMTLDKVVIRLFKGGVDEAQAQQEEAVCIDVPLDQLPFQGGHKYQIRVVKEQNDTLSLFIDTLGEIEVEAEPVLTSEVLFEKVAQDVRATGLLMVHQGGDNFTVQGRGNYMLIMEQTGQWLKAKYSVAAIGNFLESCHEERLVAALQGKEPMIRVTGHLSRDTAIIYISRLVMHGMKEIYPSMVAGEEVKQLMNKAEACYFTNRWQDLFAILDGELPKAGEEYPEQYRIAFYMGICNVAKRHNQPELLIYTYNKAPEGPGKREHRMEYTRWLASSFKMKLEPIVVAPVESIGILNFYDVIRWITHKLPSVIYSGGKEEDIEQELLAYAKSRSIGEQNALLLSELMPKEGQSDIAQKVPLIYNKVRDALKEERRVRQEEARVAAEQRRVAAQSEQQEKAAAKEKEKCVIA